MANSTYKRALERLIQDFKRDFLEFSRAQYTDDSGTLRHAGEFGGSREKICQRLLINILPSSRNIDTRGFIINANDEVSSEQDLIIFSKSNTPLLTVDTDKFFPVETVAGIGQVKSVIRSKSELKIILNDLAKVKAMRENMGHGSVISRAQVVWDSDNFYPNQSYDQITTFVICEKLDFAITAEEVDKLYDSNVPQRLKHNLICDIENGIYAYHRVEGEPLTGIPNTIDADMIPLYLGKRGETNHIAHLLTNLQILLPAATIFHVDMGVYLR